MSQRVQAVVVNEQEQHSLWPVGRVLPTGWAATGFSGSRQECLDHIAVVWTDIRPRTVREEVLAFRALAAEAGQTPTPVSTVS